MDKEWIDAATIVYNQTKETVKQQAEGIGVRLATVTCPCGNVRGITNMYKCLYCEIYLCRQCAEDHFGQTVAEYKATNRG